MIGKSVPHYRIIEKLGFGGMGGVYKAEDTNLKRPVVLKFLPEELRHALERFEHEAKLLASLNCPNIAAINLAEYQGREARVQPASAPVLHRHASQAPEVRRGLGCPLVPHRLGSARKPQGHFQGG